MKSKLFIIVAIVFTLTSCSVKESALNEDYPAVDLDTDDIINSEEAINVNNVTFNTLKVEWPIYQDVRLIR